MPTQSSTHGRTQTVSLPVDLTDLGASLLAAAAAGHASGRAARTVFHEAGLRATVIALLAGHELAEHEGPPAATLLVHRGDVRLSCGEHDRRLGPGQLVAVPRDRHTVHADTDAVVVLTVRFE